MGKSKVQLAARYANVALLLFIIVITAILTPSFLSLQNLNNILRQSCVLGLVSLGMSFVILAGHMDLSVGSILSLTGVISISLQSFLPVGIAIIAALGLGLLLGLINGAIVVKSHANGGESLMITFGTQLVFGAASLLVTGGFTMQGSSSDFYNGIGSAVIGEFFPASVLIVAAFVLVLGILEAKSELGRKIHMVGYNLECGRLSGLATGKIKLICYGLSGLMAGAAGIMLSSRTVSATPTAGGGYEMEAIIAIVLGGVSLSGGSGSIARTCIGIVTLGVISNAMNLLGFNTFDQSTVKGIILIIIIAVEMWNRKQIRKEA